MMHVNENRKFDVKKWLRKKGVLRQEYIDTLREALENLIQEAIKQDREDEERDLLYRNTDYLQKFNYKRIFRGTCPLCDDWVEVECKDLGKEEYYCCPKCPYIIRVDDAEYEHEPEIDYGNPFGGPG